MLLIARLLRLTASLSRVRYKDGSMWNKREMDHRDICDIFNKHGSDKDRKGYLQVYNSLFHKICLDSVTVLEIGICSKSISSLTALSEYFENAKIIGIASADGDLEESSHDSRIETFCCDASKKDAVVNFITGMDDVKFDVIIDSGCRRDMDRINTLRNFYPHLNNGGIYIIEGLEHDSKLRECPSLIGCLCNQDSYFFAGVRTNMCVIQKHHINSKRMFY